MTEKIYSAGEVSQQLKLNETTVRRRARLHKIGRKIGHVWCFTPDDIEAIGAAIVPPGPVPGKTSLKRHLPPNLR